MGKINLELMRKKLEEASSTGGSTQWDRLKPGKNVRRILWPKGSSESFFSEYLVHYGLGADGHTAIACPKTWNRNESCPVCDYVQSLRDSSSKEDQQAARRYRLSRRIYMNVLNRDDGSDEPVVLNTGSTVLKGILAIICDPDYGDITDPETGRDITITRSGQGMDTSYTVMPKPKESAASDLSVEQVEAGMTDLDNIFPRMSTEEIQKLVDETISGESPEPDTKPSEDSSSQYDDMSMDELIAEYAERDLDIPSKPNRIKLIVALQADDERRSAGSSKPKPEPEPIEKPVSRPKVTKPVEKPVEPEVEEDPIQKAIEEAMARAKASHS